MKIQFYGEVKIFSLGKKKCLQTLQGVVCIKEYKLYHLSQKIDRSIIDGVAGIINNIVPQYEDKATKVPIVVFKYDYMRKNELKMVLQEFVDEVVNFGIFESDKPLEAKLIARNITEFELNTRERTGYEIFVCVVKKIGCEAFLGFAGIGPYHVSENLEKGIEESKQYFPDVTTSEETQSDNEEKPEELIENAAENKNGT